MEIAKRVQFFKGVIFLCLFMPSVVSALTVDAESHWGGIFAGRQTPYTVSLTSDKNSSVFLSWKLISNNRILSKGQEAIRFTSDEPVTRHILLQTPKMKPGAVLKAKFMIEAIDIEDPDIKAYLEISLDLYGDNIFIAEQTIYQQMKIQLFDPAGETAKLMTALQLPFQSVAKQQLFNQAAQGLIVVGAGIELDQHRGLMVGLIELARQGRKILILQPRSGIIPLTELSSKQSSQAPALSLRNNSLIQSFAKGYVWVADDLKNNYAMTLDNHRQSIFLRITPYRADDWQWLLLNFAQAEGQMIVSMLPFNAYIKNYPIAQIIFAQLLVYANGQLSDLITPASNTEKK